MNRAIKTAAALSVVFLFVLTVFSACSKNSSEYTSFAMGSVLSARLYGEKSQTDSIWRELTEGVNQTDLCLSLTNPSSELSRLASEGRFKVSAETADILKRAVEICKYSDNRTDISMGAVTGLWNFSGEQPRVPEKSLLDAALLTEGLDKISIASDNTVTVGKNQIIDCGAFGKGAGCDKMCNALKGKEVSAVISLGGNLLLYGQNPEKDCWSVGIRNPFGNASEWFATLELKDVSSEKPLFISTSGDYEKAFEQNGKVYHHILNPDTGYPSENELTAVTVTGGNGLTVDGLSTACFVNGLNDKTLSMLAHYGCEGVFVLKNREVFVTEGLRDCFKIQSADFKQITHTGNMSHEE